MPRALGIYIGRGGGGGALTHQKHETCRPDSSAIYKYFSGHRKLTKIKLGNSLSGFIHCSKSFIWPPGIDIWSIVTQIHKIK